jgi:predicted transcriptional regulator
MSAKIKPGQEAAREQKLSRRERQIMDALYRLGKASASEIRAALADPPTNTAVRTLLTILEKKGHLKHANDGIRYIFEPVVPREEMARSVIEDVVRTFFDNSVELVVTALVNRKDPQLTREQVNNLAHIIRQAKKEGR